VNARFIAPAAAGLILFAACGKDTPPPADAQESTSEVTVTPATHPGGPERGVPTTPVVTGPVSFERAESSYAGRRYEEAVVLFTAYTAEQPENPWGFYMLGLSTWKLGDRVAAEQALRRALELDSTHVKARLNLGRVLIESGRPDDALVELDRALVGDPSVGEAHRLKGRAYDVRGEVEQAIAAYHRAIVLDTTDVWAMNNLGVLLIQQGRAEEGIGPLARATALRPGSPVFQNNLGSALESSGHRTAAVEAYGAALAADSTYSKARISLERVSSLDSSAPDFPIDVDQVARGFSDVIARWRQEQERPLEDGSQPRE
jgi:predicted Zn-dependent protease